MLSVSLLLAALAASVLALWGILAPKLAPLARFLVAATLAGKALGTALLGRVSQKTFRVVVLSTVVFAGTLGVATAARVLLP